MNDIPTVDNLSVEALVGRVADEFLQQLNRGEQPDIEAFARRHPEIDATLRQVLEALQLMRSPALDPALTSNPASEPAPLAGYLGDFRLVREVGRGGMGIVYEAEQVSIGRRVALKVLPFAGALDPKQLQRFKHEAQAAGNLHHTNIVPVHAVGCERGVHYYAMQFIEGQTLAQVIADLRLQIADLREETDSRKALPGDPKREETMPVAALSTESSRRSPAFFRTVARLGVQAAEALEHAHQLGVVHRDIKPANLLVDVRDNLWITDFGLARFHNEVGLTLTGDLLGTLRHMSPEQALGRHGLLDHRTDIYSLGTTLYELLTLRPVCDGQDRQEVLRQIEREEPRAPRRLNPAVPADLETIVLMALAKEPEGRYATAQELADDLERFLKDEPIRARRPTLLQRARKWARRHKPVVATATVAAAVLLVTVTALSIAFAASLSRSHTRLNVAYDDLSHEQQRTRRVTAELALDKGRLEGERGDTNLALLWMEHSLKLAPAAAGDLQAVIRMNLGAWRGRINPLQMLLPHQGQVRTVAFTPDGKAFLTASWDEARTVTVQRWHAATGQPDGRPLAFASGSVNRVLTFSPDRSTFLLDYPGGVVRLHRAATGEVLRELQQPEDIVTTAAFSPDGRKALIGSVSSQGQPRSRAGWAQLWEVGTGQTLGPPREHKFQVWAAAFSPDSQTFVTECGIWRQSSEQGQARFWDAHGNEIREPLQHPRLAHTVVFSPDGKQLLAGHMDRMARLWDLATGEPVLELPHEGPVRSVAFSPDGRTLLTGSYDGTVRLWDRATGERLGPPLWHQGMVQSAAFSPDGQTILTGSNDQAARLWEVRAGSPAVPLAPHAQRFWPLAFSPDRRTMLTLDADHTVRLREAGSDQEIGEPLRHGGPISAGAISPDGRTVVTVEEWRTTRLGNVATGKSLVELSHPDQVYAVAFSPDGRTVVTGAWDSKARFWDAGTGRPQGEVSHEQVGPVFAVAFGPDGQTLLTGCSDSTARFWDAATREPLGAPLRHYTALLAVAFSPDGKTILTGGNDQVARLWDVATRQPLGPPLPHQGAVLAVAFSPDGRTVLTGSRDRTARLWDVATGKPIGPPLWHLEPVRRVAFGPNGKTALTVGEEKSTFCWRLPAPMTGTAEQLELWAQVVTGMELEAHGGVRVLDAATWQERREKLRESGFQGP